MPSYQAGDLIVCFAFRDGNTTAPTLPAGWSSPRTNATRSGTSCSGRFGFKIAASGSETVGTWTNASRVVVEVWRPTSGNAGNIGNVAVNSGTTNTLNYPALTLDDTGGGSIVAGFVGHRSVDTTIDTAPSGMTAFSGASGVDATAEASGHATSSGVSSWSSTNQTLTGTASGWVSFVVELQDTGTNGAWATPDDNYKFSNGGKTATALGSDVSVGVFDAKNTSGKFHAEITLGQVTSGGLCGIGIAQQAGGVNYGFWASNGTLAGNWSGTIASFTTGSVLIIEIDIAANLVWFAVGAGNWNNNGSANPATGTGGITGLNLSTLVNLGVFFNSQAANDAATLNTGTSAFTRTPSSGFDPWYAANASYNQTVTVGAATSLSLVKGPRKIVSVASSSTVSMQRTLAKIVTIASAGTVSVIKQAARSIAISGTGSVAISATRTIVQAVAVACASAVDAAKRVGKSVIAAAGTTTTMVKSVSKNVGASVTSAMLLVKSIGKIVSVAATSMVSVIAGLTAVIFYQTVDVASSASVAVVKSVGKAVSIAVASSTNLVRVVGMHVAGTCSGAVAATKQAGMHIAAACAGAVTATKQTSKSVAVTASSIVAATKQVSKRIVAVCASSSALVKQIAKKFAVAASTSVAVGAVRAFLVTISATCSSGVALTKRAGKTVVVICAGAVSATKAITFRIAVACSGAAAAVKRTGKSIAASVASSTGISASRAFLMTIAVGCASAVTFNNSVAKNVVASVSITVTATKQIAKAVAVTGHLVVAILRSIGGTFRPSSRVVAAAAEIRSASPADLLRRVFSIGANRVVVPVPDSRSATTASESRTIVVPPETDTGEAI